ncbi:ammonium transporter [Ligilactobacillus sp. WILCCON 0076]|uniref:Ammonium transporter n=1 Tax=Ligilactobacillus ubinensis TaxID=2876789 RepID=A0A9X2FLE1_9LACO|nr:ammonium transporter [Ligilactobacillus ubinensis]MCP0887756.1 ammonium transporter [Ligilactobacillus ubinensis]
MLNAANSTFVIISSILVFFMTPGLAFFYGGLVSRKNVVNTMLSVFIICGLAVVLYVAVGYELSFNGNIGGVIGTIKHFFLSGIDLGKVTLKDQGLNTGTYLVFQMMFAIITPALFVGAVVGRMRFNYLFGFIAVWSIFIYYPLVHMVWSSNGILASLGVLDFAGGTVVHINAGVTALILSIFLGKRLKFEDEHYNLPWVLCGTAILWIGWYGFNAGSALVMNSIAMNAFLVTTVAASTAMITWMVLEIQTGGKPSLVGVCTGALCGLVGITPAAGYVTTVGAIVIGILCTVASFVFVNYIKPVLKFDDPLDAFGCHGVSGIVGSILTGALATKTVNSGITENGLFYGGGIHLFLIQIVGTLATIVFVTVMCLILIPVLKLFIKMRVDEKEELAGLDFGEHGERVDYSIGEDTHTIERYPDEFRGQLAHFDKNRYD